MVWSTTVQTKPVSQRRQRFRSSYELTMAQRKNRFFISFSWIMCFLVIILSITPAIQEANPKSGLAQAAMVTIYATYLVGSALISVPTPDNDYACNFTNEPGKSTTTMTALGVGFTFIALAYSASSVATRGSLGAGGEEGAPLMSSGGDDDDDK